MTRSPRLKLAVLIFLAFAAGASAAAAPATPAAPSSATAQATAEKLDSLEEIWIRGKRLSEMIEDAEDDFFALYNKLNKDGQYNVFCGQMALNPNSMIMVRACAPGFAVDNFYDSLRNTVSYSNDAPCSGLGRAVVTTYPDPYRREWRGDTIYTSTAYTMSNCPGVGTAAFPQIPVELLLMEKRPGYAKNVLKVVGNDPRLLEKARNLGGLYDEMNLTRGRYVKVKDATTPMKRGSKSGRLATGMAPR
ncbi:MAG: hypothetical protein ABI645_06775 [Pseudomonadota bacterium]